MWEGIDQIVRGITRPETLEEIRESIQKFGGDFTACVTEHIEALFMVCTMNSLSHRHHFEGEEAHAGMPATPNMDTTTSYERTAVVVFRSVEEGRGVGIISETPAGFGAGASRGSPAPGGVVGNNRLFLTFKYLAADQSITHEPPTNLGFSFSK